MNTIENSLKKNFYSFLERTLVSGPCSILIGFSGGADSVALASLFREYIQDRPLFLTLAYLEHGIRPDSERRREHDFVKDFARLIEIPLIEKVMPPGRIEEAALQEGRSIEDAAREARYGFFKEIMAREDFSYLALGHHLDDQAETLIMRFFQGSGTRGLCGIREHRENIIRPLLHEEKQTLLAYLKEKNLQYSVDSTNRENDYLRNRVRNLLIPRIEEIFPGYKTALSQFQNKMTGLDDFIRIEKETRIVWTREGRAMVTDAGVFFNQPEILRRESLFDLFNLTFPGSVRIPHRFIRTVKPVSQDTYGQILLRGRGILLERRGMRLFWTRDIVFPCKNSYLIHINKPMEFTFSGIRFAVGDERQDKLTEPCIIINSRADDAPLVFRSREPGDFMELPGGGKSIKKLYNSWHIPESDRWKIPVLEDRSGILGIIGSPWGGRNCFSKKNSVNDKSGSRICRFITWSKGSV